MSNYPIPKIVYPSGGGTTLQFVRQPRNVPYAEPAATRHLNIASSGVPETIWERTDQFITLTMEWVYIPPDISNWTSFVGYALQGGNFDYYPDSTVPGTFYTCILEDPNWIAAYKQLGAYTFKIKFRVVPLVGASNPPAASFSDTFMRANSGTIGQNWIYSTRRQYLGNDSFGLAGISSNQLNFVHTGGSGGGSSIMACVPRPIIPTLYGVPHFAQMTYVSSSANIRSGPGAGMTLNSGPDAGYYLGVDDANHSSIVLVAAGITSLLVTMDTVSGSDVMKIGVIFGGGSNLVYCYRNGTLMSGGNPYVDTGGSRPVILGFPVIASDSISSTGGAFWTNYSCGAFTP